MDVLLTHSYFLRFDPKEFRAMMPYPPLGTLYAASHARDHGFSVGFSDSMLAEKEDHILPTLLREKPKAVAIYDDDFNYLTKMCLTRMREAAFKMSTLAKSQGCIVIVHGSDSADHLEKYFAHGADYVICGEGEHTLVELLGYVLNGVGIRENINGIAYVENGNVRKTARRMARTDLDELPFPAWDLVDVEAYRRLWKNRHGFFSVNLVTTRGCPFHCNWCAKPIYGQVYNSRSPENVVTEMVRMKQNIRPDHIWFCDDIFGLKPGWIEKFAHEVNRRDARVPFKCLSRADLLLKENAVLHLQQAGCQTVWIGAESGSQKILDAMEKGITIEQIHESTRLLKDAGIRVGFFLQYGYPGEAREDIDKTLNMVRECMPDEIGVSVSYPLPGTKFYDTVKSHLEKKQNWTESADLDLMYHGPYPAEFYRALHKATHKKFRVWHAVDMIREQLRAPSFGNISEWRKLARGAYHFLTLPRVERSMRILENR